MEEKYLNIVENISTFLKNINLNLNVSLQGWPAAIAVSSGSFAIAWIVVNHDDKNTIKKIKNCQNDERYISNANTLNCTN